MDKLMKLVNTDICPKCGANDLISRRAVNVLVDELARAISDERCCISRGRSIATIMKDILDLPPVKLQEPKWIPCSERLPTKEEYIANNGLFIVSDGNRTYAEYFDIYNSMKYFGEPTMSGFRVDRCVTAWMPLPKPDKAERNNVMDDLISRQAFDEIKELMTDINGDTVYAVRMSDIRQLPPVKQDPKEIGYCKDCKYFEYDSVANIDGCKRWAGGIIHCKTKKDGYCFLFEPRAESEE